ncbi:MAG TPA: radical SAM protein [Geobacteraceae bacterium]|nr:radical SAM protein [Geobacteraceae bacterium]
MGRKGWRDSFLRLDSRAALKNLELPCLYHMDRDELYELNGEGMDFLRRCDGSQRGRDLTDDGRFVGFCLREGLLQPLSAPAPVEVRVAESPVPSLRYLELQLTHRCNLACLHCYLGLPRAAELSLGDALSISRQFGEMGGLRLMLSGGEPLLYPHLREFIEKSADFGLRRVLLTNGTLITDDNAGWLGVEEIQFSLDGWQEGHDLLRGDGAFAATMRGIEAAMAMGMQISIATMVHRGNLDEFGRLRMFAEEINAVQWGVDILCSAGSLVENRGLLVPYEEAAPFMEHAFGGGYHGSSDGFACGRHLMTVTPEGKAVKCGFYADRPLGDASEELRACWLRLEHVSMATLECAGCPVAADCAGGCRFRAERPLGPDPAMCAFYGVDAEKTCAAGRRGDPL